MKCVFQILFLTLPIGLLSAQQNLSIDDAVALALANNPSLQVSAKDVEVAEARRSEAGTTRLPKLKMNASYARLSEVEPFTVNFGSGPVRIAPTVVNAYTTTLSLQQPLFTGFRIEQTVRAADFTAKASRLDFDGDRRDLIFRVKQAYWTLYKAKQVQLMVNENVAQMKSHLQDSRNLQAQGLATASDILRVEVQLAQIELQELDAHNAVRLAMIALNSVVGLPLDTPVHPVSDIREETPSVANMDELVRGAMDRHSEIQAMEYRVKAGEAIVKAARGGWYPQVALGANYYYSNPNQRIFPTQERFKDSWDIALSLNFDLWNWGATGYQSHQARAQLEQAKAGLRMVKDGLSLEITHNYLNVQQASDRIAVAAKGLRLAEENYRIISEKFRNGFAPSSDLIDAEVALVQAKTNHTQTRVDFEIAKAALEKTIAKTVE